MVEVIESGQVALQEACFRCGIDGLGARFVDSGAEHVYADHVPPVTDEVAGVSSRAATQVDPSARFEPLGPFHERDDPRVGNSPE